MTILSACGPTAATPPRKLPTNLVPQSIGAFTFTKEEAASKQFAQAGSDAEVSTGVVYTIHHGGGTDGAIQVSLFKPEYTVDDINDESLNTACQQNPLDCVGHQIFRGIQCSFGDGHFHRLFFLGERAYTMVLPDQTLFLWFPPGTQTMVMMVLLGQFPVADANVLFQAVLEYQHHQKPRAVPVPTIKAGAELISTPATATKLPPNPDCQS